MKEHQQLEWKEAWRDEHLKWVCAFANGDGGTLVIGRNDAGQAVDLRDARKLLEDLPNKIRDLLGVVAEVNVRTELGHDYVEIATPAYPNPDIANAFFRAGEIEAWGRGIQRIFDACRMVKAPAPVVRFEVNGLWIEFPFSPAYLALIRGTPSETPGETPGETRVKTPQRILAALQRQPTATLHEVATGLGLSTSAVERAARRLQEEGRLRRVGPKKGGRWEVLS